VDERVAQRHDLAVAGEAQLDLVPLVALLGDGQHVLTASLDEPDRAIERARQERHQDVLGVDDTLGAEPSTDVLGDDAHGMLGQSEEARQEPPEDLGRLRGGPYRHLAELGVPAGRHGSGFQRHAGAPVQVEAFAQYHVGPGQRAHGVADPLGITRGHVAPGMDARTNGPERVVEPDHGG
jgi:hypothetical protein